MLVYLWIENPVDRIARIIKTNRGLSKGVLIHFQFQVRLFSIKNEAKAINVIRCIVFTAQLWTEALARGLNISKMQRIHRVVL